MNSSGNAALVMPGGSASAFIAHAEEPVTGALEFEDGLFGFPDCRSFTLTPAPRDGLYWLQSSEHRALSFLLVDPFRAFDAYAVDVPDADVQALAAAKPSDIAVLAIVTLPESSDAACTANLQGPVAVNMRSGRARQIIINHEDYGVRHPFRIDRI
jgi:flagellar assembly factor FliW